MRAERFELMDGLAALPDDMVFFTQITMEAAEDPEFLAAMKRARIKGALVGVEAVTPEGLKDVYKDFNMSGEHLVDRLRAFRHHGVHVLGSFIFGLPSDRPETFDLTAELAERSGVTFAQFVMLTPFPGTVDFAAWEKTMESDPTRIEGIPLTRHWLIPKGTAAEGLRAAPGDVAPTKSACARRGLGSLLQLAQHLGARPLRRIAEVARRVRADLEAVPADVRQHRHRHRQRAHQPFGDLGAHDRQAAASVSSRRGRCPTCRRPASCRSPRGWRSWRSPSAAGSRIPADRAKAGARARPIGAQIGSHHRLGGAAVREDRRARRRARRAAAGARAARVGRHRGAAALSRRRAPARSSKPFRSAVGGFTRDAGFFEAPLADGARAMLVDCPELFDRDALYGVGSDDYPDNARRFAFLVRAALEFAGRAFAGAVGRARARLAGGAGAGLSPDAVPHASGARRRARACSRSTTWRIRASSTPTGCRGSISAGSSSRSIASSTGAASAFSRAASTTPT